MQSGGVSKSMASLMNIIDRERYDVSLMLISPTGPFMELLPKDLRIITNPVWTYVNSGFNGTLSLFKTGHPLLAVGTLVRFARVSFQRPTPGS